MKLSKQVLSVVITIVATFLFSSCEKEVGEADGPKFETKPIVFSSNAVDTVIAANKNVKWGFTWVFDGLVVNSKQMSFEDPSLTCVRDEPIEGSDSKLGFVKKFKGQWFSVEKVDEDHIKISLTGNKDGHKRTLEFRTMAGNTNWKISFVQQP